VNAWPVIVCSSIVVSQSHMCAGAAHVPAAAPEHNQRRGHLLAVGHPGGAKGQRDEAAAIQRRPHLRAHAVLPCRHGVAHPQQPTSADARARAGDTAALSHAAVLALCMQCLD
jgi:hypothetical protein